jgi:hypothetical protein
VTFTNRKRSRRCVRRGRSARAVVASALGVAAVLGVGGVALADDEDTANTLVITAADVAKAHIGGRFSTQGSGSSGTGDSSTDSFEQLAECVGSPVKDRTVVANASGPVLVSTKGDAQLQSFVDIVETKAQAKADRAVVKSSGFANCLGTLAKHQGAPSGLRSVRAARVPVKRYGDYSTAIRAEAKGTSTDGKPGTVTIVAVLIQKGRAELTAEFQTAGTRAFDRRAAEKILDQLDKRLATTKV